MVSRPGLEVLLVRTCDQTNTMNRDKVMPIRLVYYDEIEYVIRCQRKDGYKNYAHVVTGRNENGTLFLVDNKVDEIKEKCPNYLIRIARSVLININSYKGRNGHHLFTISGKRFLVERKYRYSTFSHIDEYFKC